MRYLLIDFGASFFKFATYDTDVMEKPFLSDSYVIKSPFTSSDVVNKNLILTILRSVSKNEFDGIVCCSIIGGGWIGETYHSWKSKEVSYDNRSCLISGLFQNSPDYHIHEHHGGDATGLNLLGQINSIPIYSSLGDTNCVINSVEIDDNEYVINIGTGSQVISKNKNEMVVEKYIPAGRAFLSYDKFFSELGVNFFEQLREVSVDEILKSNINFDLNIFPQAASFNGGGSVTNLHEGLFNKSNFFGSLIRSFVEQYGIYLNDTKKTKIKLSGGISEKIPTLKPVFSSMYGKDVSVDFTATPFDGMIKYIKEFLL